MGGRRPKRGRRSADTREVLLRAAVRVVERDGLGGVTTRKVAQEADLPLGAVHYWFTDKSELVAGVVALFRSELRANVAPVDGETLGARITRVHDSFQQISSGLQTALYEVIVASVREPQHREGVARRYRDTAATSALFLDQWSASMDARLPGGRGAVTQLCIAVLDGLILGELVDPGNVERRAALALFSRILDDFHLETSN